MEGEGWETLSMGGKCGRWNPTAEQVKVLTDLFRSGLRTPSTDQIQTISAHLSAFGKIESKNVFYWFQNHKARERHHKKRRRPPPDDCGDHHHHHHKVMTRSRCNFPCAADQCTKGGKQNAFLRRQEIAGRGDDQTTTGETLELFPLKSCSSEEERKMKANSSSDEREEPCGRSALLFDAGWDPPPVLDLRLSFT